MQMFTSNNAGVCYQSKRKYYRQTLLEECIYELRKIKMKNLIDDDLEKSSSDQSSSESDNDETESDDEEDNDESNE